MNPPEVIDPPDQEWLLRLRRKNIVFAPKEDKYYTVDFSYEPPEFNRGIGEIGLQELWFRNGEWGVVDGNWKYMHWYIRANGRGFDNSQLLMPCAGHLPEERVPQSEPWVRQMEREVALLRARIDQLESERGQFQIGDWK